MNILAGWPLRASGSRPYITQPDHLVSVVERHWLVVCYALDTASHRVLPYKMVAADPSFRIPSTTADSGPFVSSSRTGPTNGMTIARSTLLPSDDCAPPLITLPRPPTIMECHSCVITSTIGQHWGPDGPCTLCDICGPRKYIVSFFIRQSHLFLELTDYAKLMACRRNREINTNNNNLKAERPVTSKSRPCNTQYIPDEGS
jgi:hypothetical protein